MCVALFSRRIPSLYRDRKREAVEITEKQRIVYETDFFFGPHMNSLQNSNQHADMVY